MEYEVFFEKQRTVIEAETMIDIGTQVSFYAKKERVAHFVVPFGASFGYVIRSTPREPDSLKAGDSCPPAVVKSESNSPA